MRDAGRRFFRRNKASADIGTWLSKRDWLDIETRATPAEHLIVREGLRHPGEYLSQESHTNPRLHCCTHAGIALRSRTTSCKNARRRDSFTEMSRCAI